LPFQEYGKPVVAGVTIPAERQTPVLAPAGQAVESFVTKARLREDGTIEGESSTAASGPSSILLRLAAKSIDREGRENAAQARLKSSAEDGSGSFGFPPPTAIDGDYSVVGNLPCSILASCCTPVRSVSALVQPCSERFSSTRRAAFGPGFR
jgi:hypothetical protein